MWIRSLGWENPLEEEMEIHSIFLPEKSHEQRSWMGYSLWSHKESDTTEQLSMIRRKFNTQNFQEYN